MNNEYIERLEKIQRDINWIISYLVRNQQSTPSVLSDPPEYPEPKQLTTVTCPTCNIVFDGVTSYYCIRIDCPTFTKVTF